MLKKILSYLAAFIAVATAFIFGRTIDRQRISRDNASIERIRDGIAESGKVNNGIATAVDTAQSLTGDITADNRTAIRKLATARELLERAKKRADDNKNP